MLGTSLTGHGISFQKNISFSLLAATGGRGKFGLRCSSPRRNSRD
ncbi:hypothetical protein X907_1330 [Glycocaulis alkaliphilus]|uniref:Uncharacterized protein n=1 Tax=Glycocaulis alkaliphilus TaxID=1434191 RepID=A0A3T0E8X6_9PROT|nr:hypothetical protein X907_1330 [Glycocaulis alkaliphilus]